VRVADTRLSKFKLMTNLRTATAVGLTVIRRILAGYGRVPRGYRSR
jgi:hypothetical protein